MLFQRDVIEELCEKVQHYHNTQLWRAMCRCINHKYLFHSAFSEMRFILIMLLIRKIIKI